MPSFPSTTLLTAFLLLGSSATPEQQHDTQSPEVAAQNAGDANSEALLKFLQRQGGKLADITATDLQTLEQVRLDRDYTTQELQLLAGLPALREVMIWRDGDSRAKPTPTDAPTDADLEIVATLGQITTVRIGGWSAPFSDVGVAHLEAMPALQHLHLIEAQRISDESMKSVARMPALESLNITYTHISDHGLEALMASKSLKSVRYGWAEDARRWLAAFRLRHEGVAFEIL